MTRAEHAPPSGETFILRPSRIIQVYGLVFFTVFVFGFPALVLSPGVRDTTPAWQWLLALAGWAFALGNLARTVSHIFIKPYHVGLNRNGIQLPDSALLAWGDVIKIERRWFSGGILLSSSDNRWLNLDELVFSRKDLARAMEFASRVAPLHLQDALKSKNGTYHKQTGNESL